MSATTSRNHGAVQKESSERSLGRLVAHLGLSNAKEMPSEDLKRHFRLIEAACSVEPDTMRRARLLEVLPWARIVHESAHRLYHCHCGTASQPDAAEEQQLATALDYIVRTSFEDEYRKVQVALGLVDAVSDLVVVEVEVYGLEMEEHRGIRRIMGNILTNLSYGNTQSKKKVCAHPGFLATITRVIEHNLSLSQVFGGLIRNLSWMADAQMVAFLAGTVPALSKSAVRAGQSREEKCLMANLSALWNLASHSVENKKVMCETEGFLKLLVALLESDPLHTAVTENASGILKYLCGYITEQPVLVRQIDEYNVVGRLLNLLNSSSFTVIQNALGALAPLVKRHRKVQERMVTNAQAMGVLYMLGDSRRDDVRITARQIISDLNSSPLTTRSMPHSATLHGGRRHRDSGQKEMSASVYTPSFNTLEMHPPRLLNRPTYNQTPTLQLKPMPPLQNPHRASQATDVQPSTSHFAGEHATSSHDEGSLKSSTLPHVRSGYSSALTSPLAAATPKGDCIPEESEASPEGGFLVSPVIEAGDLSESMQCTRSGSMQSLSSEMQEVKDNSWRSSITTAANSGRHSPVSDSDLPDSPTQCAAHYGRLLMKNNSSGSLIALSSLNVKDDGKTNGGNVLQEEEDVYGEQDNARKPDEELISEVISDFLPKAPQNSRETSKDCSGDSTLSPNSDLRKSPFPFNGGDEEDGLLDQSIDALITQQIASNRRAQPSHAPRPDVTGNCSQSSIDWDEHSQLDSLEISPKNVRATASGHSRTAEASLRLPDGPSSKSIYDAMKKSSLIESPNTSEKVRDGSKLHYQLAEDNFAVETFLGPVDPSLPDDVANELQAEQLVIHCREVTRRSDKRKAGGRLQGSVPVTKDPVPSSIPRKHLGSQHANKAMSASYIRTPPKISQAASVAHESRPTRRNAALVETPKASSIHRRPPPLAPKPSLVDPARSALATSRKSSALVPPFNYKHPEKDSTVDSISDPPKNVHEKPPESGKAFVTIL